MRRELRKMRAKVKELEAMTKYHSKELLHYDTKGKIADAYIFEKKGNWSKDNIKTALNEVKKKCFIGINSGFSK